MERGAQIHLRAPTLQPTTAPAPALVTSDGRGLVLVIAKTRAQRLQFAEALPVGATALLVTDLAQARQVMAQLPHGGERHAVDCPPPGPHAEPATCEQEPSAGGLEPLPSAGPAHQALKLQEDRLSLSLGGREVRLTTLEMDLLRYLLPRTGEVATFEQLSQVAWRTEYLGNGAHMHAAVGRLRAKLAELRAPVTLQAVRGLGFRLVRRDPCGLQEAVGS